MDKPPVRLDEHIFTLTHIGVDYLRPIKVKFLRHSMKKWCCLVTCPTTITVNIKFAKSLDTESCLAAVTIFIASRGCPITTISDKGTNFIGPAREPKTFMDECEKAKIESDFVQNKVVRKFSPPGSPHLGKRCLRGGLLSTTVCLVKQTLNVRPLTAVGNDAEALIALTPNILLRECSFHDTQ